MCLIEILLKSHFDDEMNEMKQKRSSHRDSQAVEEWCKCGKCGPMLTEKECRYWHEEVSHYLNGNIRDESRNFALSKLMIHGVQTLAIVLIVKIVKILKAAF